MNKANRKLRLGGVLTLAAATMLAGCSANRPETTKDAFAMKDAIVVWNPNTGLNNWGVATSTAALADFTNAIAKVTGRVLPVYAEGSEPKDAKAVIYYGRTRAAEEVGLRDATLRRGDWRVKTEPGRAYVYAIAGWGAATGLSDFTTKYCGYYYLTPEGADPYDVNPALKVPVVDYTIRPAVYNARIYTTCFGEWANFARRTRMQSFPCAEIEGEEKLTGLYRDNHTQMAAYLKPEKYFKDHPEYFCVGPEGKRRGLTNNQSQICYSSEGGRREVVRLMKEYIDEDRKKYGDMRPLVYDFTQQDNADFLCKCDECMKRVKKYAREDIKSRNEHYAGGDAGLQLEFVNAVAREIAAYDPKVNIRVFAYVSTERAPKPGTIKPEPNVRVWWCDLYGNSEHLRPLTEKPFNDKQAAIVGEWMALTDNIEIWDYMLYSGLDLAVHAVPADARFFRDHRVTRMFMESERRDPKRGLPQAFYELNCYLMARYYTEPDLDIDEVLHLYSKVYGKGAAKMEEAIRYLAKQQYDHPAASPSAWHARMCDWMNREVFEHASKLVDEAYALETPGTNARGRIALVRAHLAGELMKIYLKDPSAKALVGPAKAKSLDSGIEYIESPAASKRNRAALIAAHRDTIALVGLRFENLPAEVASAPADEVLCIEYHRFTGAQNMRKVDDPDAYAGKAMVWKFGRPDDEHIKGDAIACGLYSKAFKDSYGMSIPIASIPKDGKYHWVKCGTGRVGSNSVFYIPGDWHMIYALDDYYITSDGMAVDPNWYDVWISIKVTGPKYAPGSTDKNGIWTDRLVLRRVKKPAK